MSTQPLLIDALATHRITHFITADYLAQPIRDYVQHRHGEGSKPDYLVNCPWCTSIYVGAGVALARLVAPRTWHVVATALALSDVASLIETYGHFHDHA